MREKQQLTEEQDEVRLRGLRLLARIFARHILTPPETYAEGSALGGNASSATNASPARKEGRHVS